MVEGTVVMDANIVQSTSTTPPAKSVKKEEPLDAHGLRRAILKGMEKATAPSKPIIPHCEFIFLHIYLLHDPCLCSSTPHLADR